MLRLWAATIVSGLGLGLCGCGGGDSPGGGAVTHPPPPATPQSTSTAVELVAPPSTQQFATAGSALQVRFDAASGRYEVNAGGGWSVVTDDPNASPAAGWPNVNFVFDNGNSVLMIRAHYQYSDSTYRYRYSNLAAWGGRTSTLSSGHTAIGTPTPASGIPRTGSATYTGLIEGASSLLVPYEGQMVHAGIDGSVNLQFDFAAGTLAGDLHGLEYGTAGRVQLPTLAFRNTVYASGATSFSGQFATNLAGQNSFSGQFTGPAAEELIGAFAFPYVSPTDGSTQQATGAMIAKR